MKRAGAHLNVRDDQVVYLEPLGLCVGLGCGQQTQQELTRLLWKTALHHKEP
jgi:hypothetical protein